MSIFNKVFKKKTDEDKKDLNDKQASEKDNKIAGGKKIDDKEIKAKEEKKDVKAGKEGSKEKAVKEKKVIKYKDAYKVLVKPLMTEKTAEFGKDNSYVFEVDKKTNKIEIKKAVKEIYNVMPTDVNIINLKGKKTGVMRGRGGRRKDWKKAIVKLKQGDFINLYEEKNKKS